MNYFGVAAAKLTLELLALSAFILTSRTTASFFNFNLPKDAVKQSAAGRILSICLKYSGGPLIERRRAKRFQVDWQVRVERGSDTNLVDSGELRNLSSNGALLLLPRPLATGTQLDVYIKLPLTDKKWMRYPARVVRIETGHTPISAAVSFDSARPDFGAPF